MKNLAIDKHSFPIKFGRVYRDVYKGNFYIPVKHHLNGIAERRIISNIYECIDPKNPELVSYCAASTVENDWTLVTGSIE